MLSKFEKVWKFESLLLSAGWRYAPFVQPALSYKNPLNFQNTSAKDHWTVYMEEWFQTIS